MPTVSLVTQQKTMFEKYLPYKIMAGSGDASSSQVMWLFIHAKYCLGMTDELENIQRHFTRHL